MNTQTITDLKQDLLAQQLKDNDRGMCYYLIRQFVIQEGYRELKNRQLCKKGRARYVEVLKELNWEDSVTYNRRTDPHWGYDF